MGPDSVDVDTGCRVHFCFFLLIRPNGLSLLVIGHGNGIRRLVGELVALERTVK
jgi:hypothetical protein